MWVFISYLIVSCFHAFCRTGTKLFHETANIIAVTGYVDSSVSVVTLFKVFMISMLITTQNDVENDVEGKI